MKADACARSLNHNDMSTFWKSVYCMNNKNVAGDVTTVGGISGDYNVADLWKQHFEKVYNCISDNHSKQSLFDRMAGLNSCAVVTVQDVIDAMKRQKKGKAAGPDGLVMEAFIFGSVRLFTHLSLLFTLFIKHGYVPELFKQSTIVPLVKNKCGDMSDVNNYRAIALSTATSKILETIIMGSIVSNDANDVYQFGFKGGHSTALCTHVLKRTVNYYVDRGSHVFACFVDFTKAFDRVNYWKLFNMLVDDRIDVGIVKMLTFWYSHQVVCVNWHGVLSSGFKTGNGTRQGGILSPYLFTRYIRGLISAITATRIGCNVGGVGVNILAYADDIVLLAPSWRALQDLVNILHTYAQQIDMVCNVKKTCCMIFSPKCKQKVVATAFPSILLGGAALQFVSTFRYLGHVISNDQLDNDDIKREIRNMYIRANILNRRFSKCSLKVKLRLFQTYCLCFYDVALWSIMLVFITVLSHVIIVVLRSSLVTGVMTVLQGCCLMLVCQLLILL